MAIITVIGLNVAVVAQLALHSEKKALTLKISGTDQSDHRDTTTTTLTNQIRYVKWPKG